MMSTLLKNTVVLGYADIGLAGCRTLLGAFDLNHYEVTPWQLGSLEDAGQRGTDTNSIFGCVRMRDIGEAASSLTEPLPIAQIYTHKINDVSLLIINAHIPDNVAHVVANDVINFVGSSNPKEFIVLSSFPTGIETKSFRIVDKGIIVDAFSQLKCGDAFLNSIMQFALVEKLLLSVLVSNGRKVRNGTMPNEADGSMQCIVALNDALNRELGLDLRLASSFNMMYDGSAIDESSNLMFV